MNTELSVLSKTKSRKMQPKFTDINLKTGIQQNYQNDVMISPFSNKPAKIIKTIHKSEKPYYFDVFISEQYGFRFIFAIDSSFRMISYTNTTPFSTSHFSCF